MIEALLATEIVNFVIKNRFGAFMDLQVIAIHAYPIGRHFMFKPENFTPGKSCVAPVGVKNKNRQYAE
jgi:hypothetical protein|tara:strand:- start:245 stop:448 length:204 start_codon:yes stop_codon:yes gene_type:complete